MNTQSISNLLSYFFIYSFCGWALETITKTVAQKKFVNSGFLFGPICPIYGIAAVVMLKLLNTFKGNYLLTFVMSFIIFTLWEYFVGWLLEKIFHTKYWDYSYYKLNLHGRICLINSLTWGFLGIAFIEIIHPIVEYLLQLIPVAIVNKLVIIISILIIIDCIITIIKINNINISMKKLEEISKIIKEKIAELKTLSNRAGKKAKENKEKLKNIIEDLNQTQVELFNSIEKQIKRFQEAFPSMTSDKIKKFLKQKIEIKKRLNKK